MLYDFDNYCVFDLETSTQDTGPSPYDSRNKAVISIIKKPKSGVQLIKHEDGIIPYSVFYELLIGSPIIVGANLKFDLGYIIRNKKVQEAIGKEELRIWDVQIAEYLLSGQQKTMWSLKKLSEQVLGKSLKEDRVSYVYSKGTRRIKLIALNGDIRYTKKTAHGADKILAKPTLTRLNALLIRYCKGDGVSTEAVYLDQIKRAKALDMLDIIMLYCSYSVSQLIKEANGIFIDLEATRALDVALQSEIAKLDEAALALAVPLWPETLPPINLASNPQLAKLFFGGTYYITDTVQEGAYKNGNPKHKKVKVALPLVGYGETAPPGIERTKKTKVIKLDAKGIALIQNTTTNQKLKLLCTLLLEKRIKDKILSTYVSAFLLRHHNSIIHQSYRNTQTETGRLSCVSPNMQNPHKQIKPLVVSRFGNKGILCSIDFSQLELRVLAEVSGDALLRSELNSGKDIHSAIAAVVANIDYETFLNLVKAKDAEKVDLRRKAKAIIFGIMYGEFYKSLAVRHSMSEDEAEHLVASVYEKYSEVKSWHLRLEEQAEEHSQVSNKLLIWNDRTVLPNTKKQIKDRFEKISYYQSFSKKLYIHFEKGSITLDSNGKRRYTRYWYKPKLYNYPIQGTAADIQAAANIAVMTYIYKHDLQNDILLINEVHDDTMFDIYTNLPNWQTHIKNIKEIMENTNLLFMKYLHTTFNTKIDVEIKLGSSWDTLESTIL